MKRQIVFLLFCYFILICVMVGFYARDRRPIAAPTFIWPTEVACYAEN